MRKEIGIIIILGILLIGILFLGSSMIHEKETTQKYSNEFEVYSKNTQSKVIEIGEIYVGPGTHCS